MHMNIKKLKRRKKVTVPTLAALAATRGMLGMGAGMLLSRRIPQRRQRPLAWTLVGIGVATTVPLAAILLRK
jgi:hypothetical protein